MRLSPEEQEYLDWLWSVDHYYRYPQRITNFSANPFPISGPQHFVASVNRILEELQLHDPLAYQDAIGFLPKAEYDESLNGCSFSGGKFGIDGSDYKRFRYVFLHEVGHCIGMQDKDKPYSKPHITFRGFRSEDEAYTYAWEVLANLPS